MSKKLEIAELFRLLKENEKEAWLEVQNGCIGEKSYRLKLHRDMLKDTIIEELLSTINQLKQKIDQTQ